MHSTHGGTLSPIVNQSHLSVFKRPLSSEQFVQQTDEMMFTDEGCQISGEESNLDGEVTSIITATRTEAAPASERRNVGHVHQT